MDLVIVTGAAAVFGILATLVRIPPLVGFLAAGFLLGAIGIHPFPGLAEIADIGVTLLLFTIGLKFDVRTIVRREAYGTGLIVLVMTSLLGVGLLAACAGLGLTPAGIPTQTLVLLSVALSFSSTVLSVKVLQERSDEGSFYGQTAIAILVIQDLAAIVLLTVSTGMVPSLWALGLVLLVPFVWAIRKVLERVGREDLLVLVGLVLAVGPGYQLFEAVGIKGDLGALVIGLLFAGHSKAGTMSKALFGVKELFLVGFFLLIGLKAVPTWGDLGIAVLLCAVLLTLKILGFTLVARVFGMRNRTASRTGLLLGNFSEFSLILVAMATESGSLSERWLSIIALAVALGMVASSLVNGRGDGLASWLTAHLRGQDPARLHPSDRPIDTTGFDIVILGMGRVGRPTYESLRERGVEHILGVDNDLSVVAELQADGYEVVEGDATDLEFWNRLCTGGFVNAVVLALPTYEANAFALGRLRHEGFSGRIVAVAQYEENMESFDHGGIDSVFNLYTGAGSALADEIIPPESTPGRGQVPGSDSPPDAGEAAESGGAAEPGGAVEPGTESP